MLTTLNLQTHKLNQHNNILLRAMALRMHVILYYIIIISYIILTMFRHKLGTFNSRES